MGENLHKEGRERGKWWLMLSPRSNYLLGLKSMEIVVRMVHLDIYSLATG